MSFSQQLQSHLDQLRSGDSTAYAALWDLVNDRLTVLTRKMKRTHFQSVGSWELTEDIAQNARIRLIRAVQANIPATPRAFFGLANLQIRRELLDTIRTKLGRNGERLPPLSLSSDLPEEEDHFDPELMSRWLEFHERIAELPDVDRELVELLWYQGLTHEHTAEILSLQKDVVRRLWQNLRARLVSILPSDNLE